jgi:hypothetical protein
MNYTTYDLRREQDSINPRTHADIMVLAHEEDASWHPYWYARVLGIFHMMVEHVGPNSRRTESKQMDFLLVRWFGRHPGVASGWAAKRLPRVGFLSAGDSGAFGFLDPQEVIRGVHLIPAFAQKGIPMADHPPDHVDTGIPVAGHPPDHVDTDIPVADHPPDHVNTVITSDDTQSEFYYVNM